MAFTSYNGANRILRSDKLAPLYHKEPLMNTFPLVSFFHFQLLCHVCSGLLCSHCLLLGLDERDLCFPDRLAVLWDNDDTALTRLIDRGGSARGRRRWSPVLRLMMILLLLYYDRHSWYSWILLVIMLLILLLTNDVWLLLLRLELLVCTRPGRSNVRLLMMMGRLR